MKMCPRCKKVYANRFEKCDNCQECLIVCTKDDLMKYTTVQETKKQDKPNNPNIPKCPTCGSTNIRHISATERGVNAVVFGIFGTKRKCQFECLNPNCKYRW